MSSYNFLKFCPECKKLHLPKNHVKGWGYIFFGIPDDATECKFGHPIQVLNITVEDYCVWSQISDNPDFYDAMIKLHNEDIIEYELKMSQFRTQVEQQKALEKQQEIIEESSKPKCPHCNSTNIKKITGTERAASVLGFGILSKKIGKSFKCLDCKYTW